MEFRILGPLEVIESGRAVEIGARKQQLLLGILLLHPGEVVSAPSLIDELWRDAPPASAAKAVQGYVYGLRKALGAGLIRTRAGGYAAVVEPERLDAACFRRLASEALQCLRDDPVRAVARFDQAISLWRGGVLEGLPLLASRGAADRLTEQRAVALEHRIDAVLALDRHAEAVPELRELIAAEPYRERLRAQLMLALYRCGRQAEALAVYHETRRLLADELALDPGEELRVLQRQILVHDPELKPRAPADDRRTRPGARRLVSVLRASLADPGQVLDLETRHTLLARGAAVIERHGGAVDRFADDAILAVFGLAESHDDDALRAVRAASELGAAVCVDLRVAVVTGRVIVGPGESFATGSPVTAVRQLQAAAASREILLDERTRRLVAPAIVSEAAGSAWRLLDLHAALVSPPAATPLVGRQAELRALSAAFEAASRTRSCRLITVLGPPGIGKSRLLRELIERVGNAATVLVGRCLSYGEAITYRPIAEIIAQVGAARVEALVGADGARRIQAAIGASDEPGHSDETFLAVRRLFEALAAGRPLIVAIEDVHWAEPTLLDLLDHVAALSTGAPILLVCLARPELIEARPSWPVPQPNRSILVLDGLADDEAFELVRHLSTGGVTRPILDAAEGNPFFLEQLVAVDADEGVLPDGIHAVLAARIDRLEPGERALLSHAAVEGRSFHAGVVAQLLGGAELAALLVALVRKGLIRAERPEFGGEDVFRFDHALIREVAYDVLPKRRRATLHERVGRWLEGSNEARDESIGYHLARAYEYALELGGAGPRERGLARDAARRLATAARAALVRGDIPAGAQLLERATALLDEGDRSRCALLLSLGIALFEAGRLADAERVVGEAIASARTHRDERTEARACVEQQYVRFHAGASVAVAEACRVADWAAGVLAAHGDELGQCRAWRLKAWIAWTASQVADADEAWARAAQHARAAGEDRELFEILGWRASAAAFGGTPVPEAIRRCTSIREQVRQSPVAEAVTLRPLGLLHAMAGEFDEARRLIGEANAVLGELGRMQSVVSYHEAEVELIAGRPAVAEHKLRPGYSKLEAMGERSLLATTAALLAQAVFEQERPDEAEALCEDSERHADPEDLITRAMSSGVRARVLARRGELDTAEALARTAVSLAALTDQLTDHGDALLALADVLDAGGRPLEADAAGRAALEFYERKRAVAMAERARSRVRELQATR